MPSTNDSVARIETVDPSYHQGSEDGFVGTDPIYENFANETDRPLGNEVEFGEYALHHDEENENTLGAPPVETPFAAQQVKDEDDEQQVEKPAAKSTRSSKAKDTSDSL